MEIIIIKKPQVYVIVIISNIIPALSCPPVIVIRVLIGRKEFQEEEKLCCSQSHVVNANNNIRDSARKKIKRTQGKSTDIC